jgi:hypothetical protein
VNDGQSRSASGLLNLRFSLVGLFETVGRIHDVFLATEDLVFGVKGLDGAFGTAVSEASDYHGR